MKKFNYKYKTTENFIKEATDTHSDKYNYSLVNYINAKTKVKIICPTHGEFEQIPRNHIRGQHCQKCSGVFMDDNYFIEKAIMVHGDKYNYSFIDYKNSLTPVKIICPIHGEFEQRPKDHLIGKECQKCSGTYMDTTYFIEKANKIHDFKYNYNKAVYKKTNEKLIIICEKHGEFIQIPNAHLNGSGCPICKESKGEREIRKILEENNIKFESQKKYSNCKNIKELPFDFYLPEYNTCIEYNGEQHYKSIKHFGGEEKLIKTQKNDIIKFNYCKNKNINLLIINDIKTIKEIMYKLIN